MTPVRNSPCEFGKGTRNLLLILLTMCIGFCSWCSMYAMGVSSKAADDDKSLAAEMNLKIERNREAIFALSNLASRIDERLKSIDRNMSESVERLKSVEKNMQRSESQHPP